MIKNRKITLLAKLLLILPSAIILFLNPKYAFIYLIVCFAGVFVFERYLSIKDSKEKATK